MFQRTWSLDIMNDGNPETSEKRSFVTKSKRPPRREPFFSMVRM